jgi:tripartite-type tricarboxylate transporter receptor subunit TctC
MALRCRERAPCTTSVSATELRGRHGGTCFDCGRQRTRSQVLPEIPIMADFVPGYEPSSWYGIGAPRNTPVEIVAKLNKEISAAVADPSIKARLGDLGTTALALSPADFGKFIAEETDKWAKVVKFSGAKPD